MTAAEFNKIYPIGIPVVYTDGTGLRHHKNTASEAWDILDITVVNLEGWEGNFAISDLEIYCVP